MLAAQQRPFGATTDSKPGWWESLTTPQKLGLGVAGVAVALLAYSLFSNGEDKPRSLPAKATPNRRRKRRKKAKANPPYAVYRTEKVRQSYKHEPFDRIEDAVRHAERDAREKHLELVVYDEGKAGQGPHGSFVAMFRPNKAVSPRMEALTKQALRKLGIRKPTCKAHPEVPSCRCSPPAKYARMGATRASDYAFPECFMYPLATPELARNAASRFAQFGGNLPPDVRRQVKRRIDAAKKKFGIGEYRRTKRST